MEQTNELMIAYYVPSVMLGNEPESRSTMQRGSHLIAYCEAAGIDPVSLLNPDVDYVIMFRFFRSVGV